MVYGSFKYKMEQFRQRFWFWMMLKHPKMYHFFEKTPFDTLPF